MDRSLPDGVRFGQYVITAPLGAGGMGEVYRARDEQLDREVAVKVLPASSFGDPAARARLVVLYEMAAGRRPFPGQTSFELSAAILNEPPPPLPSWVPPPLGAVIARCLARDGTRYQSAADVRDRARGRATPGDETARGRASRPPRGRQRPAGLRRQVPRHQPRHPLPARDHRSPSREDPHLRHPASNLPRALEKAKAEETLSRAGYRPLSVSDAAALEQALAQDKWDLVIADLADGGAVRGRLQGRSGAPMVVPVVYRATGGELAEAKRDYLRVVKGPLKSQAFLEAIDDAVALREKLLQARTS